MWRSGFGVGLGLVGVALLWLVRQTAQTPIVHFAVSDTQATMVPPTSVQSVMTTIERSAPWILAANEKSSTKSSAPSSPSQPHA